jgi:hypothetical protein
MRRTLVVLGFVALTALYFVLQLRWAVNWAWSFDSDEAIFGLMARHIQQGAFPFFYYGQSYIGSFSSLVLAGLNRLLGAGPSTVKLLAMISTWAACMLFALALARRYRAWSLFFLATAILVSPAAHLWTAMQRGPAEQLFTMGLVLVVWLWWLDLRARSVQPGSYAYALLGLAAGFALWNHLGVGLLILPLALQELLQRTGFARWRARFRFRDLLSWSRSGGAAPGRILLLPLVYLVLGAEVIAFILFLAGGKLLHGRTGLLFRLHYPVAFGLVVLILLGWYFDYLASQGGKNLFSFLASVVRRWFGTRRVWLLAGFAVGILPGVVGFVLHPGKVQFPLLTSLAQIPGQFVLLFRDTWGRIFGLSRNPAGWLLQVVLLGMLAAAVGQRRHVWAKLLRLRPVELSLVDVLLIALAIDVVVFLVGDLAPGSATGFRYLVPVPLLMAATVTVFLAEWKGARQWLGGALAAAVIVLATAGQARELAAAKSLDFAGIRARWNERAQEPAADSLIHEVITGGPHHLMSDYWLSYRLTFLAQESLIVAPLNGMNRYPQYVSQVLADPRHGYLFLESDTLLAHYRAQAAFREKAVGPYRLFAPTGPTDSVQNR